MCDYTITFYNAQVKGPMVIFFIFFYNKYELQWLKKIYMYIKAHVGTYMLTMKYSSAILFLNILKLMLSTVNYIARHLYKLITAGSWIQSFFFYVWGLNSIYHNYIRSCILTTWHHKRELYSTFMCWIPENSGVSSSETKIHINIKLFLLKKSFII